MTKTINPFFCYTLKWKLNNLPVFLDIPALLVYSGHHYSCDYLFRFLCFIIKPLRIATQF